MFSDSKWVPDPYQFFASNLMPTYFFSSLSRTLSKVFWKFYWIYVASRGATGVASVRWHQQLSPCQTESIPVGSKRVLPLAVAETISDADSTSGIMHLRKGRKRFTRAAGREEWEHGRETVLPLAKSGRKEGEVVLQEQPRGKAMVKQVVTLQPMTTAWQQISTAPPMGDTAGGHALKKANGELIQKLSPGPWRGPDQAWRLYPWKGPVME